MNIKKIALGLALASCFGSMASAPAYAASSSAPISSAVQAKDEYHLINDTAGIYDSTARMNEEEELKKIFSSSSDKSSLLRMYTFIYDSMNKDIPSVEEDLISQANLESNVYPIIFIYNSADKSYKFIIDERVAGYIPKAYLQHEMDELVTSKSRPTSADFDELLNRASTMLVVSSNANLGRQSDLESAGVTVDESKFEVRDFGKVSLKKDEKNEDKEKSSKKDDGSLTLILCGTLILVIVGGAIVFKRKQNKPSSFGGR